MVALVDICEGAVSRHEFLVERMMIHESTVNSWPERQEKY